MVDEYTKFFPSDFGTFIGHQLAIIRGCLREERFKKKSFYDFYNIAKLRKRIVGFNWAADEIEWNKNQTL